MPKVSFTREEIQVVYLCLNIDRGGGDMRCAIEFLVERGDIKAGKVDETRLMVKLDEARDA